MSEDVVNTTDIINLMKAYTGETQARFRYKLYAEVAKEEGYEQIAAIFLKTSEQETEHAEIFFDLLKKYGTSPIEVKASYPVSEGTTLENLKSASKGEHEEWVVLYQKFADESVKEDVEKAFSNILKIEKNHERRFNKLIHNMEQGKVFKRCTPQKWECRNCGNIHEGLEALVVCPTCGFPVDYAEIEEFNY